MCLSCSVTPGGAVARRALESGWNWDKSQSGGGIEGLVGEDGLRRSPPAGDGVVRIMAYGMFK
jgi:hypothetical protein